VMIFVLALLSFSWRRERLMTPALSLALPALVVVQAAFGMLTVTWRLKPIIVTTHLLLGLTTLSLLWWLVLGLTRVKRGPRFVGGLPEIDLPGPRVRMARRLAVFGLIALVLQILLGGWTSSNYAALACPDLPTCQNAWWPAADFQSGFSPARDVALNDGPGLGSLALVAIQLTHRIGALVLSLMLLFAGIAALRAHAGGAASLAASCVIAALGLQLTIGISMVLLGFPLALATAHNAGAALLLLATLALNRALHPVAS
jgi:heme a synthase